MDNAKKTFRQWIIAQGNVPEACQSQVPSLEHGVDGAWAWNRMVDDRNYLGPTSQPINMFSWTWGRDGVGNLVCANVVNAISTPVGETQEVVKIDLQEPAVFVAPIVAADDDSGSTSARVAPNGKDQQAMPTPNVCVGKKRGADAGDAPQAGKRAKKQQASTPPQKRASTLVVLGLGTPGCDGQRHNLGASIVASIPATTSDAQAEGVIGVRDYGAEPNGRRRLLLPPQGPINNSGDALKNVISAMQLEDVAFLIVADDCNLPLGMLRLKAQGSSGGHNGLTNVESFYGERYHRLRVGIGGKPRREHVVGTFSDDELPAIEDARRRAALGVKRWLNEGPEDVVKIMGAVNTKGFGSEKPSAQPTKVT